MSASFNTAVLGPALRVGVLASLNASPGFPPGGTFQTFDGGLVGSAQANTWPTSSQCYWIGPDGTCSSPVLQNMINDGYDTQYGGIYFDPVHDAWVSIGGNTGKRISGTIGMTFCNPLNGSFTYRSFMPKLVSNALNYTGFFSQSQTNMANGYGANFFWAGIDRIGLSSLNTPIEVNGVTWYLYTQSVSLPYGLLNWNFPPVPVSTASSTVPPNPYFSDWILGPVYRQTDYSGLVLGKLGTAFGRYNFFRTDFSGNFNSTAASGVSTLLGRLFNGFVYDKVFPSYSGCVYTEDFVTFHPLVDITGQIDFTQVQYFGLNQLGTGTYFHSAFGFSYLANYSGNAPFTKAAYKIYPAFPFIPMTVPDSFFIPSVCGCNRRSNRA